jgi:pimeloyl-ACP methyl ester carboxylesterase
MSRYITLCLVPCRLVQCPVFFIHGTVDEVLDLQHTRDLYARTGVQWRCAVSMRSHVEARFRTGARHGGSDGTMGRLSPFLKTFLIASHLFPPHPGAIALDIERGLLCFRHDPHQLCTLHRREPYIVEGAGHDDITEHDPEGYLAHVNAFLRFPGGGTLP